MHVRMFLSLPRPHTRCTPTVDDGVGVTGRAHFVDFLNDAISDALIADDGYALHVFMNGLSLLLLDSVFPCASGVLHCW